jgi:itaconyl-CoA hydratase
VTRSDAPDLASFPIRDRGVTLGDFTVGEHLEHHWGRTLTEADHVIFNSALCYWNPMGLNAEFARAHGHRDLVVNPALVLCTVIGLSVEDLSESGGPFLGIENCTFPTPVYPGDTITSSSETLEVRRSSSRPDAGIVTWKTTGVNQRGEVVCQYVRSNLIADRTSS